VDRHLFGQYAPASSRDRHVDACVIHGLGLKKLLKEGEEMPKLYSDPTFLKSSHWTLSTSNLTSPMIPRSVLYPSGILNNTAD
jgi:hypothetical protein